LKKLNSELLRKLNVMNFLGIPEEIGRKSKIFPNSSWKKYQKKIVSSVFKKKRKKKLINVFLHCKNKEMERNLI